MGKIRGTGPCKEDAFGQQVMRNLKKQEGSQAGLSQEPRLRAKPCLKDMAHEMFNASPLNGDHVLIAGNKYLYSEALF